MAKFSTSIYFYHRASLLCCGLYSSYTVSDFVLSRSVRLWQHVTRAINNKDQTEATNEKFILEEAQRKSARERKAKCEDWIPALFEQDPVTGEWHYRYAEWVESTEPRQNWLSPFLRRQQTKLRAESLMNSLADDRFRGLIEFEICLQRRIVTKIQWAVISRFHLSGQTMNQRHLWVEYININQSSSTYKENKRLGVY